MKTSCSSVACFLVAAALVTAAEPPEQSPKKRPRGEQAKSANALMARFHFAPMWMPIPEPDDAPSATAVHWPVYVMVRQAGWQKKLGLTGEQSQTIAAIDAKARADAERLAREFNKLSPADQRARVQSATKRWVETPAPWRDDVDKEVRRAIDAVVSSRDLQTLQESRFPEATIGMLYDADLRRAIGFGAEQENQLRRLARERLARLQAENLTRADRVWQRMTREQQAQLPDLVKRQGPTSAILSVAYDVGFDFEAMALGYPMISEPPVRERLALTGDQERKLQVVAAEAARKAQRLLEDGSGEVDDDDRRKIEAILAPEQLAKLKQIDFRRAVILALGYPEKRESIGIAKEQVAQFERWDAEVHQRAYEIDREMLGRALELLTPGQWEKVAERFENEESGR